MKNKIMYFSNLNICSTFIVLMSFFITQPLIAQTEIWDAMSKWGQASNVDAAKKGEKVITPTSLDGNLYRVPYTGSYVDFKLPDNLGSYKYVHVTVRGADGGNRINEDLITPLRVKGGGGATLSGFLRIGNANKEVSAGDTFRFIAGAKGGTIKSHYAAGCDGGGGTGLFLKEGDDNSWNTVMIAGGGGGAFSDCCLTTSEGRSASTGPDGLEGGGSSHTGGNGGTDGSDGNATMTAGEGGGFKKARVEGVPVGSFDTNSNGKKFNFGCGHGGRSDNDGSGAGGGGYSGGGAGSHSASGGGGGSYYNEDIYSLAVTAVANDKTNNPINGYIEFQFITTDFPSARIRAMNKQGFCIGTPSVQSNALQLVDCEVSSYRRYWDLKDDLLNLNISGRCLVKNPSNDDAKLGNCITSGYKKWAYVAVDQEIRSIENNEKCLAWDNLYLKIENCNNTENQKWGIDGATINLSEQKVASIRPYVHQSNCIDNSAGKTTNGNKIQIWNCGGTDGNNNQKWFFDGDAIRLSNHRDKCLDIPKSNTSNGTDLQLYTCNGSSAQQWIYDGYNKVIRSKINTNKCIDLTNGSTTNGTVVQIWDCQLNNSNMQWTLKQATPNPEDETFGAISLIASPDKCIDLKNANASNGANIQIWPCKQGEVAQTWYLDGDNQIKYIGRADYCLSLKSTSNPPNGDNVHIWECKGKDNQKWTYDATTHLFRSKLNPDKCLDVSDGVRYNFASGRTIQLWDCQNNNDNQKFVIKYNK